MQLTSMILFITPWCFHQCIDLVFFLSNARQTQSWGLEIFDGANMPWSPELSFWWNPLTSTHRLSSLFFSPAVEALVCELYSCYIFAIASNTPTTWSARCFGASPAVGARGALLEDKWLQQDHGRYRNNNVSAPGWTMIKSRLQCMCERSFTVRCSMFHIELFFCHKPQSSPEWMYSSPKWTKQPESNWEQL